MAFNLESLGVDCRAIFKKETSFGELEGKTLGSSTDELSEKLPTLPLFSETTGDSEDNSDAGLFDCWAAGRGGWAGRA